MDIKNILFIFVYPKNLNLIIMTAIEWLVAELKENGLDHIDYAQDIIDEALEIEKLQIIEAAIWMPNHFGTEFLPELGNQYYKERYGKEKL